MQHSLRRRNKRNHCLRPNFSQSEGKGGLKQRDYYQSKTRRVQVSGNNLPFSPASVLRNHLLKSHTAAQCKSLPRCSSQICVAEEL